MRVTICAVGRMKGGPEAALVDAYLKRFDRVARGVGLGPAAVVEVDARGGGVAAEARLLRGAIPKGAAVVALDERGAAIGSEAFASRLLGLAERGLRDAAVIVGGADGLEPGLRDEAELVLSLGPMVWPHMLVRVMLAEQLYRAASILAGTPYHRGG